MNFNSPPRIAVVSLLAALSLRPALAADAPRAWPANPFAPLTAERIAALPLPERPAWQAYWAADQALAHTLPPIPAATVEAEAAALKPIDAAPKGGAHTYGLRLDAPADWYATAEAQTLADRVVAWQSSTGAWNKGIDYTRLPSSKAVKKEGVWANGTFDNDATIYELRFLALAHATAGQDARAGAWRDSFLRGLHYVYAAQYPNGGWPQIYPVVGSYHDAVTFNDDAMMHSLGLLRDIAGGKTEFAFVPADLRAEAQQRLDRGVRCVLATQLKSVDGKLTVWCQQYDALTLQPCAARNFEPMGDAALESATIAEFLMSLPHPSPEIVAAVDGAVGWFQRRALTGLVWVREPAKSRGEVVAQPGAPLLWSRYYEFDTGKPIFGDRDRTIHYVLAEISAERRAGYNWYGDWPAAALETYPAWHKKNGG